MSMVITPTQFLALYEKGDLVEVVNVKVGVENRIYARQVSEKYRMLYAVLP